MNALACFILPLSLFNAGSSITVVHQKASTVLKESAASSVEHRGSPVSRVVKMLNKLYDDKEVELKHEEGLYEKFMCYSRKLITQKEADISEAALLVTDLNNQLQHLASNTLSLTTEHEDLKREVKKLEDEILEMQAERNKEKAEYQAALDEMNLALEALEEVIEVLQGVNDKYPSSFLGLKTDDSSLAEQKQSSELKKALEIGERFLDKADALFLRRVMTGDTSHQAPDYRKLNKKATFKMSYTARSAKILALFKEMRTTFGNRKDAIIAEENKADELFTTKLLPAKRAQLDAATLALGTLDEEANAKAHMIATATAQVENLQAQAIADNNVLDQAKAGMIDKTQEWQQRKEARGQELEAIKKTIGILHSDDARDTFAKSFKSQGYMLLQKSESHRFAGADKAVLVLNRAALKTGDKSLEKLAADIAWRPNGTLAESIDLVIQQIDGLIANLNDEKDADLRKKEACEADRSTYTQEAASKARDVDEFSDKITGIKVQIADYEAKIKKTEEERLATLKQKSEAEDLRAKNSAAFLASKEDDTAAMAIVREAIEEMGKYYTSSEDSEAFVQRATDGHAKKDAPIMHIKYNPPLTWKEDEKYGGMSVEGQAVIAAMEEIVTDIERDMHVAKVEDDKDKAETEKLVGEYDAALEILVQKAGTLNQGKADEETKLSDEKGFQKVAHDAMRGEMQNIKDIEEGCQYYTVNYQLRQSNRIIEIDGLNTAKTYLMGGVMPR